jgi:3-methyladenine DNA glycosylase/8-oxoguanine DNA glycosylase
VGRFDLATTVASGLRGLGPPWTWCPGRHPALRRAERLHGHRVYLLEIRPAPNGVVLRAVGPGTTAIEQLAPLAARVRRALQLDVDLTDLHRCCRSDPALRWIARAGLGRVVRGTTLFEDCLSALLDDAGLAALLSFGVRCPEARTRRACPTPRDLATVGARGLRARTGLDRRADAVVRLARAVEHNQVDLAAIDDRAASASRRALLQMLHTLPGVSPGTALGLAPLLGHHERLVLDRRTMHDAATVLLPERPPTASALRRRLTHVAPWGGLVLRLCAARGAAVGSRRD